MKNSKILTFIVTLVFAIVSMLACFPGSASATTISLANDDYENAQNVLSSICPDFPLSDGEVTTRAEFVAAITMVLGIDKGSAADTGFSDVPANDPYAKNIAYAANLGLINSVDLFYPQSSITYAQALKIVMTAAGYGKKAEYQGGFPTGYLMAANEAGVGKNFSLDDSATISHAQATELIFEACCTDMLEVSSYGSAFEYRVTEGKNILSLYKNVYMAQGVVNANENTGLYSASANCADGFIMIGTKTFKGEGLQNYIGKNIRVFYNDDSKNSIVYAYELLNKETTYTENDALVLDGLTLTVSPEDLSKDVKYTLETDCAFIFNGKAYGAADYSSYLNPVSGTITLIDNDDNNKIDTISVKDFEYGVVGSVNEFSEKIYDKYKKNAMVDLSANGMKYFVTDSEGNALKLHELEADSVIGYARSKDGMLCEIVRYSERVGGTYDANTSEGKICLGDKEFKLSKYYIDNVKPVNKLKMGTEVILHLSTSGQVVYVQEFASAMRYAFVVAAGERAGIDGNVMVKLYTDEGKMLEADIAQNVKFNGAPITQSDLKTELTNLENEFSYAYRVVKYSLNAEGKVNKIFTAVSNSEGTNVLYSTIIPESRPVIYYDSTKVTAPITESGTISYEITEDAKTPMYTQGVYSPYFAPISGAVTMQVPVRPSGFSDDENFHVLTSVSEGYKRVAAFDVTNGGAASFILLTSDTAAGAIGKYTGSGVIESITDSVNEDGQPVKIIKMYFDGGWNKYYFDPEKSEIREENGSEKLGYTSAQTTLTINDFAPGDIVRIAADADNVIAAMTMNFDCSKMEVASALACTTPSTNNGRVVEFVEGYPLSISSDKKVVIARGKIDDTDANGDPITRKITIDDIDSVGGKVDVVNNTYVASFARGTTLFVTLNCNRTTKKVESAVVSKESDLGSVETYFNAGKEADYIVLRQYFREAAMNIIYVNIDEPAQN